MVERMKFEEFQVAVVNGIKQWLPENFRTAQISLQVVTKNNDKKLTGLSIRTENSNIAPMIYLESFYKKYEEGEDLTKVLEKIAEVRMAHEVGANVDVSGISEFAKCRERIFPRLSNAEWSKELLLDRPYKRMEDLAVTFYIDLGSCQGGSLTMPIKKDLMESWGVTAEDLLEISVRNLNASQNGMLATMGEVLGNMMLPELIEEYDGNEEEARKLLEVLVPFDSPMFILTNQKKQFGAAVLLDKGFMQKVLEQIGEEFYILPSSIHEVILIPVSEGMGVARLKDMVQEVNETQVAVEDRLSDNIYRYSMEEGLKLA